MYPIELLSIDLSNYCSKQCEFCYNHSTREGNTQWKPEEVMTFAMDCIGHGIKAVSLGGGEPFEYEGVFDIIDALYSKCYLSVTSNGLPLEDYAVWQLLCLHKPDKIHLTIHHPDNSTEVKRVERLLRQIESIGIKPGLNLLVSDENVQSAKAVYAQLSKILSRNQIILVPQRFSHTPSAKQLSEVAANAPFQSPSCLLNCHRPTNFCSVSWDKNVNSCSFAYGKVPLETLDYSGLVEALDKVKWRGCSSPI